VVIIRVHKPPSDFLCFTKPVAKRFFRLRVSQAAHHEWFATRGLSACENYCKDTGRQATSGTHLTKISVRTFGNYDIRLVAESVASFFLS
jgi:hypothetical protein